MQSNELGFSSYQLLQVLRRFGAVKYNDRFKLVIAGFKNLYHHYESKNSQTGFPLGNLGELVPLKDWNSQEADDFITYSFTEHLGINVSANQRRRIKKYASTTPAFLQKFARNLLIQHFRDKGKLIKEGKASITRDQIISTFESPGEQGKDSFQEFVVQTLAHNLSALGKMILFTILDLLESENKLKIENKIFFFFT